jgi:hypothetical protein
MKSGLASPHGIALAAAIDFRCYATSFACKRALRVAKVISGSAPSGAGERCQPSSELKPISTGGDCTICRMKFFTAGEVSRVR